ncbi:hypothetical protein [Streptosporangium lutulentum]|uniref:Uncharacterized protein n=1 Tax=Streptosporangium lutulentum TaxID=1461250 RepID=A0ABT9Q9A0_9ACTN|nr:hypothetical protein [Streptosporangium lutulentum]MDP9843330.1 hypothetical protein [Streptosporangium lutulentum]
MRKLIDEYYDGNATGALLDLAEVGEVAVNYLDRDWFISYLDEFHGVQLTDEGWVALVPHLEGYDAHICANVFPNVQNEFAAEAALNAGLLEGDEG